MSTKTSRELALERRKAMSDGGKNAVLHSASKQDRVRSASDTRITRTKPNNVNTTNNYSSKPSSNHLLKNHSSSSKSSSKNLAIERRKALSLHGKSALNSSDRTRNEIRNPAQGNQSFTTKKENITEKESINLPNSSLGNNNVKRRVNLKKRAITNTSREIVLARREAQSKHGKSASKQNTSAASLARRGDPDLTSREISQRVRELRSKTGATFRKGNGKCRPCGPNKNGSKNNFADASWKVGSSETDSGQTITGTQANRSLKTTGNEASTCRTITGTQYLGKESQSDFCEKPIEYTQPSKVQITNTSHGNTVTGNEVGRSDKVTGDEPGTCKNLTGTEYISANQSQKYCGGSRPNPSKIQHSKTLEGRNVSGSLPGRSYIVTGDEAGSNHKLTGDQYLGSDSIQEGRPAQKVGQYKTLNGSKLTGTGVGRAESVTGNESGSCKNVTGDEYIGSQQFDTFCQSKPNPEARKVGLSLSSNSQIISGTMTGRSTLVTGDEYGTCKPVTGTPYSGLDQADTYCSNEELNEVRHRTSSKSPQASARLTGKQPSIGGVMTGDNKGSCKSLTGTPYIGGDQTIQVCSDTSIENNFANSERDLKTPWKEFSIASPSNELRNDRDQISSVTGTEYEKGKRITGPFDMAPDKVTGTEQFRFDNKIEMIQNQEVINESKGEKSNRPVSRITGEGQSAGLNITGDDWDRGQNVTGTEGASSRKRNPSKIGLLNAMAILEQKRNEELPEPSFLITGSSGNTREGQLVTFSGGARG